MVAATWGAIALLGLSGRIDSLETRMDSRFDSVDGRLDGLGSRIDAHLDRHAS
jgi:hypothetical protein